MIKNYIVRIVFILFLTCLTLPFMNVYSNSGLSPLITNIKSRNLTSLDGKWHIIIDRYENGYYDYRLKPSSEGYMKNEKPSSPSDRIEYDFDKSPLLDVPGDWNSQLPELLYYEGTVWYKKSFDFSKKEGTRLFLHFGAVNYHAIVYLNGKKLGEHVGGFTAFNFEITDKVKEGSNFIVVKVDNTRKRDAVPTVKTDWWNYGGITRSVNLIEVPHTYIRDYALQLDKKTKNKVNGWMQLDGKDLIQKVEVSIPETKIKKEFETNNAGYVEFSFNASLDLWSPDHPKLYTVNLISEQDQFEDKIGFRTIDVKGDDILLNGKSVFLRGVCIHEEAPFRSARAHSIEDAENLLGWAKDMGCNFVRLAHYPHNENMIRTADKMGLMVWSEIPVYWTILWENKETLQNARNQLEEMITRDRNKASVIIWSMSNETPVSDERNEFLKQLVDQTREMDNTRLVSAALEKGYKEGDKNAAIVDDPFGKYVDVLSFNEYIGWYDGLPDKCTKVTWEIAYDKPVIISEFGAGALQGFHGTDDQRWTEEFQEDLYEKTLIMLDKMPHLRGTTPWILIDFRSPNRVLPEIQDGWNRKGLISDQGIKKKAFYVMKNWYESMTEKEK